MTHERIAELEKTINGKSLTDGYPDLGDWVLVKFVDGFIQPFKVAQYVQDKWGNCRFAGHADRVIERWWPLAASADDRDGVGR